MRRSLASLFALVVFIPAFALAPSPAIAGPPSAAQSAQASDQVVAIARQLAEQGNPEAALLVLRASLASRPDDPALKQALVDTLTSQQNTLLRQLQRLRVELSQLGAGTQAMPKREITDCDGNKVVRVGGDILSPRKLEDAAPVYPQEALDARAAGAVIVEATIGCDGTVSEAKVLRGVPLFNQAALDAVRKWRYAPTLMNGVPVPVVLTATVTFRPR